MRGHAEESPEVTAKKILEAAARRYAGIYLANPYRESSEVGSLAASENALGKAAIDFAMAVSAAVVRPVRAKRKPKPKA